MADNDLFLGFDLSTQQLKGIVVKADLKLVFEAKVDFDADLRKYGITKGVLTNPSEGEIFAPNNMWLEAFDLVLQRLKAQGLDFSRIAGISGAGMQHGTVFWSTDAEKIMSSLNPAKTLVEQMGPEHSNEAGGVFSHPHSPNWQDASTQKQCEIFDLHLGSPGRLAMVTGSKAHHRFSGPQILRFRTKYPEHYKKTARISLVSSFIASIFMGKIAPIDIGDVGGMNMWDVSKGRWQEDLLALVAGEDGSEGLKEKLGPVPEDGGETLGPISPYFVHRFGFRKDCAVIVCTGDNPSTILALPLQASDAIVSLGTSTTFLMSTPQYQPDPSYHFMNHPATAGLYMFMLCYKNGGLAREHVRDAINDLESSEDANIWAAFNRTLLSTPALGQKDSSKDNARIGLFFPRPEIVPNVKAGSWRYLWNSTSKDLKPVEPGTDSWPSATADARAIVESQFLSLRLRSHNLVHPQRTETGKLLPAQPRRVYLVGGGSNNDAIAKIAGEVLGGSEGVFKLDIGGNACALGSAYKAVWGCRREGRETFEDFVEARWKEEDFVKRVADGYTEGVFEQYGNALTGFEMVENEVIRIAAQGS
ncbi:D-xylulose kinase-like protein [Pseudovirgaria hyperparasitica]|uniref:Xylulose kinase n=1 Tax=Pseudovirgaria hyperparasitica TaxID=470096 RepID=A0A6A6W358_9PEZI|nr:D-xylulose kinase-like protein [Pseudovirgaria hyperparasitica]KAF2756454.1 D-xylulose kinase-like protein [Pseudovirgaria hyperparasitica]